MTVRRRGASQGAGNVGAGFKIGGTWYTPGMSYQAVLDAAMQLGADERSRLSADLWRSLPAEREDAAPATDSANGHEVPDGAPSMAGGSRRGAARHAEGRLDAIRAEWERRETEFLRERLAAQDANPEAGRPWPEVRDEMIRRSRAAVRASRTRAG